MNEALPLTDEEAQTVYEEAIVFPLSLRKQHILSLISSTEVVAHFTLCLFCQHLHIKHDTFQKDTSAMSAYIDIQTCQQKKQLHSLMHKYIRRELFLTFHQFPLDTVHDAVYLWAMLFLPSFICSLFLSLFGVLFYTFFCFSSLFLLCVCACVSASVHMCVHARVHACVCVQCVHVVLLVQKCHITVFLSLAVASSVISVQVI